MIRFFMLWVTVLVMACSSEEDCDRPFDRPFVVEKGATYCLPDGARLTIEDITTSYCPCNANCVWEGEAVISATWLTSDGVAHQLRIHEVQEEVNPEWINIADIALTRDCTPEIVSISIVVSAPIDLKTCDKPVEIDADLYAETGDEVFILEAEIVGDCINLLFGASGCDGETWTVAMYDAGVVAESFPVQRFLRFGINNSEECQAYITKSTSYDLSELKVEGNSAVLLNLGGWEEQLRYEY